MAGRLQDKVAFVTGAGGPMGRAIAERMAQEGAALVITDISNTRLGEAHDSIASIVGEDRVLAQRSRVTRRARM